MSIFSLAIRGRKRFIIGVLLYRNIYCGGFKMSRGFPVLPIIFSDEHMVVVNKPWNMLSVPGKPEIPRRPRYEEWEISIMETPSVTAGLPSSACASILEKLSIDPKNIPRKEQKFYQYLQKSHCINNPDVAQEAWRYINIVDKQIHSKFVNFSSPNVSATEILRHSFPMVLNVHRLDQETSGVLVAALTEDAGAHISKQFRDGTMCKTYIAVVAGHLDPTINKVCVRLRPDLSDRPKQVSLPFIVV